MSKGPDRVRLSLSAVLLVFGMLFGLAVAPTPAGAQNSFAPMPRQSDMVPPSVTRAIRSSARYNGYRIAGARRRPSGNGTVYEVVLRGKGGTYRAFVDPSSGRVLGDNLPPRR